MTNPESCKKTGNLAESNENSKVTIAIDGPAGAGKSTVARKLADKKELLYIDTGAMYRAATWLAIKNNLPLDQGSTIANLLKTKELKLSSPKEKGESRIRVFINDEEITEPIRGKEVSDKVSRVAAHKEVRSVLVEQQRKMAAEGNVVLDGRDIGTVVLPDADLKIFLTASNQERARRRVKELNAMGESATLEEIHRSIVERDERDSTRETAPLLKAEDAIEVNTDGMTIEQVVAELSALCKRVTQQKGNRN